MSLQLSDEQKSIEGLVAWIRHLEARLTTVGYYPPSAVERDLRYHLANATKFGFELLHAEHCRGAESDEHGINHGRGLARNCETCKRDYLDYTGCQP